MGADGDIGRSVKQGINDVNWDAVNWAAVSKLLSQIAAGFLWQWQKILANDWIEDLVQETLVEFLKGKERWDPTRVKGDTLEQKMMPLLRVILQRRMFDELEKPHHSTSQPLDQESNVGYRFGDDDNGGRTLFQLKDPAPSVEQEMISEEFCHDLRTKMTEVPGGNTLFEAALDLTEKGNINQQLAEAMGGDERDASKAHQLRKRVQRHLRMPVKRAQTTGVKRAEGRNHYRRAAAG